MAIDNPFEITYGSRAMGGTSDTYLLSGPYVIDKTFENIRLVFDVVVVATSYENLQDLSDNLEVDLRKRDQTLLINLEVGASGDVSLWTYTFGDDAVAANDAILNSKATCSKTGDAETDRGFSRSYTITIEGDLPADDSTTGLRDLAWTVSHESGGQRKIMMRGTYTTLDASSATTLYQHANGAAAEATTFLSALSGSSTYEMVDETYSPDRTGHIVTFERQFVELLVNQSQGTLDNTNIFDHNVRFIELINQPGDSQQGIHRLRRVVGNYDCAIDLASTVTSTDVQSAFTNTVRPHVIALFETTFNPSVFCIEDSRVGYDETSKRMSVALQILYQPTDASEIVELQQSAAIREIRTLDRTPIHEKNGFAAYVDAGWDAATRVSTRTVTAVGLILAPIGRLGRAPKSSGWNVESSVSQSEQRFVGDPTTNDQLLISTRIDTVVETFNSRPGGGGSNYEPGSAVDNVDTILGRSFGGRSGTLGGL